MTPIWEDVIKEFIDGNYLNSLVLLFPQIEHSLRRFYVCSNGCEEKSLTAESDVLYTTLDVSFFFQ